MHPQSDVFYRLTGVVMHHGAGARKGHYTYVKEDGGKPVLFDDAAISIFDSNRILTDGYLFQYELIPDDDNICHHSLPGVFHAIKETMGSEIDNSVPFTLGLSVRKNELLQLIEKLEISNDNIHNSWKIYKLLQESIGPATFYNGEDYLQEVIKAVLEYFCRNCPNVLQRAFGLSTIRHAHCASCNFKSTHNQHDIITDIDELQPVHTYLSTASKSTCTVCGEKSLTEEKYITKIGNTVIVTGFLDMIYPKSLQQLGAMYSPRAFLSPSGTILFRGKDNNVLPLLLEESGSLINISSDDISSTLQDTTNPCIFLLDRRSDIEVLDPLYKLIEANGDFQIDSETLSLSIPAEDISLIEKFTAPFTSGSLKLEKDDVDRFLHKDFSDKNIDAFCHTLTKEDNCIIMPAAWYHDSLSSLQKEFTWFDKKCIMIPANVRQNHWILIVIRPAERTMYYLDPLAMEPITEVLDRVWCVLNNQCVLETFTSVKGHWIVQNLMETGLFPVQRDSSSCGPLTCLYVTMIKGNRSVGQLNVTGIQLRQYILNEIIKSYKEQAEGYTVFGIHNIILTSDLDEIVHNIVTGKQKSNTAHNSFMENPNVIHRKALIGYGSDFIERDEYYEVESYLFDRYFTQIKKPFRLPNNQCIFDDADELNKKLLQNFVYKGWYVDCVLVKEVLAEVLGRIHGKSGTEIRRLCIETEFSATEAIKDEIKGFREARKKLKMD